MKTKLIYSIITLLLLTFSESNASINNDTLFTSPNENTELVQQLIDSLVSIDTDYVVHVKKIDNSTDQTLYSNFILWADVNVKEANKYGIKELDEVYYSDYIAPISEINQPKKLGFRNTLFKFLNAHQRTLFGESPLPTIEYTIDSECKLDIIIRKRNKKIEFSVPCNLESFSDFYKNFSNSLYYTFYLLITYYIVDYPKLYVPDNKEEEEIDLARILEPNYNYKRKIKDFLKGNIVLNEYSNNRIFNVFLPLENHREICDQIIDSLKKSGINDIVVFLAGQSIFDSDDTTHIPSSYTKYILWNYGSIDSLKAIQQSRYSVSTIHKLKSPLFQYLELNKKKISDTTLVNQMNSSLRSEENNSRKRERELELKWRKDLNYPIKNYDTNRAEIICLGKEITDRVSFDISIHNDNSKSVYEIDENFDSDYSYTYKDNSGNPLYNLYLLINDIRSSFEDDFFTFYGDFPIVILNKDYSTNLLDKDATKKYWIKELEKQDIYIEEMKEYLKELESENNSK